MCIGFMNFTRRNLLVEPCVSFAVAQTGAQRAAPTHRESIRSSHVNMGYAANSGNLYHSASLTAMGDGGADWVGVGVRNEQI